MKALRFEVHQLPPAQRSPNYRGYWTERYRAGRVYQLVVFYSCVDARNRAILEGMALPLGKAVLNLTFIFPKKRRRDRDNLLARFKPGLDGIVQAGLVIDDDVEHLHIGDVNVEVDPEWAPLTVIELMDRGEA